MANSVLTLNITLVDNLGSETLPGLGMTGSATVGTRETLTLAVGDNTFVAPPTGSHGAVLVPSAVNVSAVLTHREVGASANDQPMSRTGFCVITWDTAPASVIVNAASVTTGQVEAIYF